MYMEIQHEDVTSKALHEQKHKERKAKKSHPPKGMTPWCVYCDYFGQQEEGCKGCKKE